VADLRLISLVGVDLTAAVAAPIASMCLKAYWPLQVGAAVVGVWTFLLVWIIQHGAADSDRNRTAVRDAIVSAFVTTELMIVSWSVFSRLGTEKDAASLDPLAQTLLAHFTYLTGIVIAAHLGAGALEKYGAQRSGQQPDGSESQSVPDPDTGS
jgi:hypothetical protein